MDNAPDGAPPAITALDASPQPVQPLRTNLVLLLVDDSQSMIRMLKSQLEQRGFRSFKTAANGIEALDILANDRVDAVLSDIDMPGMDGMQLLARAREQQLLRRIPFILVTAKASPEHILSAVRAGIDDYLVKPVNVDTLITKLNSALVRKQAQSQGDAL